MIKNKILDYVSNSPYNTNRTVLEGMLDSLEGAGGSGGGGDEQPSPVDALIARTATVIEDSDFPTTTAIGNRAFASYTGLTYVSFPAVTTVGEYAFESCTDLVGIHLPSATALGNYCFSRCKNLSEVYLPKVTKTATGSFEKCTNLAAITLPSASVIFNYTFDGCNRLKIVDFPTAVSINICAFRYNHSLKIVILRNESMCALQNQNAFDSCYHFHGTASDTYNPNGEKDGYIYVPAALIESYKAATNWVTFADQFRALEDYTVDGTISGELDPTKTGVIV